MALREPKDILHKGKRLDEILDAHARWLRNEAGGVRADLSGAKLFNVRLRGLALAHTDFSNADLRGSDLSSSCDLTACELTGSDLREARCCDSTFAKAVMAQSQLHRADFSRCDLTRAILTGSQLVGTRMQRVRAAELDARSAKLFRVDARNSDFSNADFSEAECVETQFGAAWLRSARLERARFLGCDFRGADLTGASVLQTKFDHAWFGHTRVAQCDLSRASGLETVQHFGPTWLDAETLALGGKNLPLAFLYGAGVPESQAAGAAPADAPADGPICFLGFAARDKEFAERLRLDLMANRVRCWFLPEGVRWEGIELERPPYDRLVLVCSRSSLQSRELLAEMEAALAREEQERADVVVPVRVDDFVFEGWEHARKPALLRKVVGDFRSWKQQDLYRTALDWLLQALRNPAAPPAS